MRFTGFITIPADGEYTFEALCGGSCQLGIGIPRGASPDKPEGSSSWHVWYSHHRIVYHHGRVSPKRFKAAAAWVPAGTYPFVAAAAVDSAGTAAQLEDGIGPAFVLRWFAPEVGIRWQPVPASAARPCPRAMPAV